MKKIIAILITAAVLMSLSVIAIQAVGSDNIELPETDTTATEAAKATEAEPEITEAVSSEPETTEPVVTEPETMEAEVTEPEPEIPEEIRGILGTFYLKGYLDEAALKSDPEYYQKVDIRVIEEYRTLITFNADRTVAFRVYYIGGASMVYGTYDVVDNKINIKLDLENSFFKGGYKCSCKKNSGNLHPYMNDEFVFEIVDNDKIVMSDTGKFGCYVVRNGDAFVREQWWLNTVTE